MAGTTGLATRWSYYDGDGARDLRERLMVQIVAVALEVVGEPAGTAGRDERHALGVGVLNAPERYIARFQLAVAASAGPSVLTSDADLGDAVVSVWNDIAGVKA